MKPMRPHKNAPLNSSGKPQWGRYNIWGWGCLYEFLRRYDVDTGEFSGCNDGDLIKAATCRKVADTIESHFDAYLQAFGVDITKEEVVERFKLDIVLWRTCGGYRQY